MRVYNFKDSPKTTAKKNKRSFLSAQICSKIAWPKKFKFGFFKFKKRNFFSWVLRLTAFGIVALAALFLYYSKDLPNPNRLVDRQVAESTKIFDRNGELLYEIHGEAKRTLIKLDQIPTLAQKAVIAIEDKDFYKHSGISYTGILRAVYQDILQLKKSQGGSTITQQFVKNAILTRTKSFDRKLREIILSIELETRFSKDQILEFYLNEMPYGRNAYGIEAASKTYFGKNAKDINLAQSAYLAAILQAPSFYNPLGPNRDNLDNRKNTVLRLMREQGYITDEEEKTAKAEVVEFTKIKTGLLAPHFSLMVQSYLAGKYGEKSLEEGGLKVYTSLDLGLQKIAETAVKKGADNNVKKYSAYNAALVAIDPKTGQVLAMVGSKDYFGESEPEGCKPGVNCKFEPNVNVALSQRQPGSSFKPYVYVTAFKKEFGYAPASMLMDVVTNFGSFAGKSYIPHNYDGAEHGPVSMRTALAGSLNIPAVKTLALVGVENAVQTARDLGITSPMSDCGLSLVLGGCEVRLLDHTAAYSALANGGTKNPMTFILKIEEPGGKILEEYKQNAQEILDKQAVYQLTSIMTDNNARSFVFGSNSPLTLPDRQVAAKTGTTNLWGNGWTMGFTPSLAAGVWVGNNCGSDEKHPDCLMKKNADGVLVAAPIWRDFMLNALKGTPPETFQRPAGIQDIAVDSVSGKLPTGSTPSTKTEVFADYNIPTAYDDVHLNAPFDSQTGLPANADTPIEKITYKTLTVFRSEKPTNPNWEEPVKIWAESHGFGYNQNGFSDQNAQPQNPDASQIKITEPALNIPIKTNNFKFSATVTGKNPIIKVEFYLNGLLLSTLNQTPYEIMVDKNLTDGQHTLAVKATDTAGVSGADFSQIIIARSQGLKLVNPANNSLIVFPLNLKAESSEEYTDVEFFYQKTGSDKISIGKTSPGSNVAGKYQYLLDWQISPGTGTFEVFAETGSGISSKKTIIEIP